jgi:hypothetical protein
MTLCIPLNILIYERGARGAPTTQFLADLGGRTEEHEHTIAASIGFESMTEAFTCGREEAMDWLMNGLGRRCEVYGPDAEPVHEGQLTTVEAEFEEETRSISLDEMANRVVVRYTDANGNNTFEADLDLVGQDAYGVKVTTVSRSSTDPLAAAAMATAILNERSNGVKKYGTTVASGGGNSAALRLGFSGWYTTLGWPTYANGTGLNSSTLTSTTTQTQTLLTSLYAINPFLSTDYSDITASGQTDTEFIGLDTTYRTKIEALLRIGTSTFVRQCWGVYEGRRFSVKPWAGATPDTVTYQRSLKERVVRDGKGNIVPLWLVRPDAIYQVVDLLDVSPAATAPDSAARSFVERVTCRIGRDSVSLRLEGQGGDTLDDVLARLR